MSRYDWPAGHAAGEERDDDPAGRGAWIARRRLGLDLEGALQASRAGAPGPRPGRGGRAPFAPGVGAQFLWQPLGPLTILSGQAEGRPRVTGRINALAVHPLGQRLYAGAANGGVWYSGDGGASWTSVGGLAATNTEGILRPAQRNAVGALWVEWGATVADDLVLVGTGEVTHGMLGTPGTSSEGGLGIFVGQGPARPGAPDDPWDREARNLVNSGVYAIARQPGVAGGGTITAATRIGLWERPVGDERRTAWVRPTAAPFDTHDTDCTDLLWTPAAPGGVPARCWVWVKEGPRMGLWVRDAGAAAFARVQAAAGATYGYTAARASLAASSPPTHVWVLNDRGAALQPGLFRVTNPPPGPPASPNPPVAHPVVGVPHVLRDQGWYDIAIAVHPRDVNHVAIAGSWLKRYTPDSLQAEYNASIVVGVVAPDAANADALTYGHPAGWTHVGVGAHPDVHALAWSDDGTPAGVSLWTGCDGGIFRSDRPDRPAGFYPRNAGFSIAEANFLGGHPRCEGYVLAGLQDNGTIERLSSAVWRLRYDGDGGGVALNPLDPSQHLAQYTSGTWSHHPGTGTGPLVRGGLMYTSERDAAEFYSMPACIAHVRTPPGPAAAVPLAQVLIGTYRPWFSDDFGVTWRTLPSGSDPLPGPTATGAPPVGNMGQDSLGEAISTCRWQSPDVAWVLLRRTLLRYWRDPGSHDAGGAGTWHQEPVMPPEWNPSGKEKKRPPAPPTPVDSVTWTDVAPNMDGATARGPKGAVYVGTIGHEKKPDVDTLWWFDGTAGWHRTRLREAVPAPVVAIATDPSMPDDVWVGTTVGVWHGRRTVPASGPPTWVWTQRVNGLPEAAVEDLQIFRDGDLVLLRAAIAARGVWELRLDQASVPDLVYVRAHDDDLRHRVGGSTASLREAVQVKRDGRTPRSWHGSPDVRPRPALAPVAAPSTLPWHRDKRDAAGKVVVDTEVLRRFQSALRSRTEDPRVVPNGRWDAYFSEVLRDHGAPTVAVPATGTTPALSRVRITAAFWNTIMGAPHGMAEPWGAGPPTEADLHELVATEGLAEGDAAQRSCVLPRRRLKVDVVVHRRGPGAIDGGDVRVTLLRWVDASTPRAVDPDDAATWPAGNVPWTTAVNQVLASADGRTTLPLGAGWSFCEGATAADVRRRTLAGRALDALRGGVATFDVDLTTVRRDRLVLLVAVVRTGNDPADDLAPAPLRDLALRSPHVAVRSVATAR